MTRLRGRRAFRSGRMRPDLLRRQRRCRTVDPWNGRKRKPACRPSGSVRAPARSPGRGPPNRRGAVPPLRAYLCSHRRRRGRWQPLPARTIARHRRRNQGRSRSGGVSSPRHPARLSAASRGRRPLMRPLWPGRRAPTAPAKPFRRPRKPRRRASTGPRSIPCPRGRPRRRRRATSPSASNGRGGSASRRARNARRPRRRKRHPRPRLRRRSASASIRAADRRQADGRRARSGSRGRGRRRRRIHRRIRAPGRRNWSA